MNQSTTPATPATPAKPTKPLFPVAASMDEIEDETNGVCYECGQIQCGGCEPDARTITCESCGVPAVHGLEEALIDGKIELADEFDDE